VKLKLTAPEGWVLAAESEFSIGKIDAGKTVPVLFVITSPGSAAAGTSQAMSIKLSYEYGGKASSSDGAIHLRVVNQPPKTDSYLSDIKWEAAEGVVLPTMAPPPGAPAAMTGGSESPVSVGAVSLAGKKYDKGLSASAPMAVSYYLGGNFKTFSATIGQADSATPSLFGPAAPAIAVIRVLADGKEIYNSGDIAPGSGTKDISLDVSGVGLLMLTATDNTVGSPFGSTIGWANAKLTAVQAPALTTSTISGSATSADESAGRSMWWLWVVIAVVVIAILAGGVYLLRRKR
jgi:hypothetical protein